MSVSPKFSRIVIRSAVLYAVGSLSYLTGVLFSTFCRLVYHSNSVHAVDCPHMAEWQWEGTNDMW